ncbi:hypothetical protein H6G98_20150 [Nostoc sp. FACHB-857]|nr:hypothetical protein [Nostoc sp. FACHB-857]
MGNVASVGSVGRWEKREFMLPFPPTPPSPPTLPTPPSLPTPPYPPTPPACPMPNAQCPTIKPKV